MAEASANGTDARIVEMLREAIPGLIAAYRFGSAGTEHARAGSDVDLAFLSDREQTPLDVWDLAQRVAMVLGRDVDLVDLARASTVMAAQVIAKGRLLVETDTARREMFEAHALSDYARLNEERREILEDIRRRGSIHGR